MVSLYSTWWIKPGHETAIESALHNLAKEVNKHEDGTIMYLVNKPLYNYPLPKSDEKQIHSEPEVMPGTIVFFEKYKNWDAFQAHLKGDIFKNFISVFKEMFVQNNDGDPFIQVVFLEEITGFMK